MKMRIACLAVVAGALLAPSELVAQPNVKLGTDPADLKAAVRYRAFNNGNQGARIAEQQADVSGGWTAGKCVQITYDGSGTLQTKVAAIATPCSFTTPLATVTKSALTLGTLNYLEITIEKHTSTTSVALTGMVLTPPGAPTGNLGPFSLASPAAGPLNWSVTGIDLSGGFVLTGTLGLSGLSGGGDSNFVEIRIGELPEANVDDQGPQTSNVYVTPLPVLLNGEGTVQATVDDTGRGDSQIAGAQYSLNEGPWTAMDAEDDEFDEVVEGVEASFIGTVLGVNEVCVRGADVLGNVGPPSCQTFLVTYKFDGFFSPIENVIANVAKAGQAVPVKWRLTDANDIPIDDAASFAGLLSSLSSCNSGEPTDGVEEYAAGGSGLQYVGDGYWQFNWKTPKDYANTCRGMWVVFNSGATSPVVKFQFKK